MEKPTLKTASRIRTLSLLLVEDDHNHADIFQMTLRNSPTLAGVELVRADSLTKAQEMLEEASFDIVVLDLGLPESSGIKTLSRFLKSSCNLPVIVLTTISDVLLGEDAIQMGAMDYFAKDELTSQSLARAIRHSMERWKQKQALEQNIRDLQRFGDAAAHDLMAPLKTIQGFAKLLDSELQETGITAEIEEYLSILESSSKRAATLVSDLLEFAKIGNQSIKREPLDLMLLANEVTDSLQASIAERDATVSIRNLPILNGDRSLVTHVLQNLIANAIKYSHPDRAPQIEIESQPSNGHPTISVRDNGMGINSDYAQRIFEPFERLVNRNDIEGSGLGLSICKRIIEAHDGKIWLESEEGKGSCFHFHLGTHDTVSAEGSSRAIALRRP